MAAPEQMYRHALNPLKGWPNPCALDFHGSLHSDVTISPLNAGSCVHVDSISAVSYGPSTSGGVPQFKTGVVGAQMGIFLLQGSEDFDVDNPSGNSGTDWYAIAPKGIMSGLVATGAYELETTQYDSAQTYLPNERLRAIAGDTDATAGTGGGNLTNQGVTHGTNAFVGVVSRGEYTNAYGRSVIAFWPVYAPTASA